MPSPLPACLLAHNFHAAVLGKEFNYAHKKCEDCPPGTYRPLEGSTKTYGPPEELHTPEDDALRICVDW